MASTGASASSAEVSAGARGAGAVLMTLAAGQFVMALDTSVMNVSIGTVANDVGTTVTGVQTAITLYTLVMASLMITGGKIGQILGRKRVFAIGCVIYASGCTTGRSPRPTKLQRLRDGTFVGVRHPFSRPGVSPDLRHSFALIFSRRFYDGLDRPGRPRPSWPAGSPSSPTISSRPN